MKLRLYITGDGPAAEKTRRHAEAICEAISQDCELEVIDVSANPEAAGDDKVVAVPTLLRVEPEPTLRVVGDLSQADEVARYLGGGLS